LETELEKLQKSYEKLQIEFDKKSEASKRLYEDIGNLNIVKEALEKDFEQTLDN